MLHAMHPQQRESRKATCAFASSVHGQRVCSVHVSPACGGCISANFVCHCRPHSHERAAADATSKPTSAARVTIYGQDAFRVGNFQHTRFSNFIRSPRRLAFRNQKRQRSHRLQFLPLFNCVALNCISRREIC
jgi:hypothetical protein